ncbi:MAG TPA: hypothetical protein VLK88_02780 [Gemmatimonadales bacterium]|nr:hypothetical protein [Gemmatimonadales bacterium]
MLDDREDRTELWDPGSLVILLAGSALICLGIWHVTATASRENRRERRDLRRDERRENPTPR